MSTIVNIWLLKDFCATHGRVVPHYTDEKGHFTEFHCTDMQNNDSETIICSEEQSSQINYLEAIAGVPLMSGYVVEFDDNEKYLFCTKNELNTIKQQSNYTCTSNKDTKEKLKEENKDTEIRKALTEKAKQRLLLISPMAKVVWDLLPIERQKLIVNKKYTPKAKQWIACLELNYDAKTKQFKRPLEEIFV